MKLYFSLNKPLECGKVCNHLNKAIHQYLETNGTIENAVMIIEFKESQETTKTLKLECITNENS